MHVPPFQLDHWLNAHEFASPAIRYNLAASTGPRWTVEQLLALAGDDARAALADVSMTYVPPHGGVTLRRQIGALHDVDPDWVVVTTGASEALSAILCMAAEPGGNVVLPELVFPAIPEVARLWGLRVKTYPLLRENGFAHEIDQILTAVDARTRLVLVTTPHNPTGAVMPFHVLAALTDALAERGIPLVVNEVYHPVYFGPASPTAARLPNTRVVGDLSKAFALSGLRIGWVIEPDPSRRQQLIDARSYFTISGSPVAEALASVAVTHASTILERTRAVASHNLAHLADFMRRHQDRIAWVRPDGGTTAFPWLADGSDARPLCEQLARRGVLMVPGDCFGASPHVRIGFGAEADGFREALAIASDVLTTEYGDQPKSLPS